MLDKNTILFIVMLTIVTYYGYLVYTGDDD